MSFEGTIPSISTFHIESSVSVSCGYILSNFNKVEF